MPFIFTTLNYNFSLNVYVMKLETFLLFLYKFTFFSKKKKKGKSQIWHSNSQNYSNFFMIIKVTCSYSLFFLFFTNLSKYFET